MKTVLLSCSILFLSGCQYFQKTDAKDTLKTVDLLPGHSRHQHESVSERLMIATQGEATTNAGLEMIKLGGNAVDAAAAASFAISVERPHSTGIGGGGFMIIDGPGLKNPVTIDFREKAPYLGHSKMFLNADGSTNNSLSVDGILASGVPGLVKGVYESHKKYGKLPWATVVQPAIDLAEKGFKIYPSLAKALKYRANVMRQFPASKKIFFKNDSPMKEGDLLVQRDLAKTLKAIQKNGADGFYNGWVADAIVSDFKKHGGLITRKDLEDYNVVWRDPVVGSYKGHKIYSMGPPSSGGDSRYTDSQYA